ncbi:MAG: NAD(P)H-dependent oxidoreductase subunit E [Thiolinea sp.]
MDKQPTEVLITQLQAKPGSEPHSLLQYLIHIQHKFSHISQQAIDVLVNKLGVTEAQVRGVIDFYAFLHHTPRGQYNILVSDSITDHMLGSRALLQQLCAQLGVEPGVPRADGRVCVQTTSCTGMCDQGPALLVNDQVITRLDAERIRHIAELIEQQIPLAGWDSDFFVVEDNIRRSDLLLEMGLTKGAAIRSWQQQGSEAILAQLDQSGLRGRGGAGFKTSLKWKFCRQAEDQQRYVVCNADEGEPGTFKDRVLLNSYADEVIEGMTLCGAVIGADKGFIYLRGEYFYLLEKLEAKLQQRREQGLLGNNILGIDGLNFDLEIHLGAGAYICGEESALIESLEGKRGIPRNRPPFPVTNGYLNKPTVVNNVETFMAAAGIAVHGGDWFRVAGTADSGGTKLHSISGNCARPGIYEYPLGTPIRQMLADCGAENTQAVQVAGAAGETLFADEFDRSISFEDVASGGSLMVFNQQRNMLDMVQNFAHFFVHESCGFCTPCRVGGSLLSDLLDKLQKGHASDYDLQEMQQLAGLMQQASHCGLGSTAPNAFLHTLSKAPQLYRQQLKVSDFEPAFDLDQALSEARRLAGVNRTDTMESEL